MIQTVIDSCCYFTVQLEKQQKLNELDMVTTLQLHQIQYIINQALPSDLTHTLVFESPGVTRLQHRIKELEHEKTLQKKHMKSVLILVFLIFNMYIMYHQSDATVRTHTRSNRV